MSGKVLAAPVQVKDRIVTLTEGGLISTFSTDGYRKYERPLKKRPSKNYTVTKDGIILSISNDNKSISFYNPDGYFVWNYSFEDEIAGWPEAGFDGRIFVSTKKTLYCFGVTGSKRWEKSIPSGTNDQILTLNDGTLLCMTYKSGKESYAYRFTPYGDMLEEITFSGKAVLTAEHEEGVLILFSDGTFGCCSVKENCAVSLWATPPIPNMLIKTEKAEAASILRIDGSTVAVLYPNGLITIIDTKDGREICRTAVSSGFSKGGLYYGAGNIMAITEFSDEVIFSIIKTDGTLLWSGMRKTKGEIIYYYTGDGFLLQFTDNWILSVSKPWNEQDEEKQYSSNGNFIERPRFYNSYTGNKEEIFIEDILADFKDIMEELQPFIRSTDNYSIDPSIFEKDMIASLRCIKDAALTGYDFSLQIAWIIRNADNESYVKAALDYCLENGYDPDAYMISALYTFVNTSHVFACSDVLYKKICDSIESICKFTGADIFKNYGSRILVKFMSSGYSTSIKEYAVSIMKSLMELQI
ncbi:MAG: hypothetical protein K5930_10995 [Treponemataceae bacterium]|nr:hypothetical protein [Treponemataceae bacterium]